MALSFPPCAEADMAEADAAPDEEIGKSSQGEQPAEDLRANRSLLNEGEKAEKQLNDNTPDRATLIIDVSEEPWAHAIGGHGLHCTCRAKCARVGNADDGDRYHNIHD